MILFGKELSEGSDVTIQVRFGLVTGRRLIAWSGTALATEDQIIEEISSNPAVAKYLQKPIERGRVKPDENDCVTIDAYIVALDGERILNEHKIQITFALPIYRNEPPTAAIQMERLFSQFSAAMAAIVSQSTQTISQITQHSTSLLNEANKALGNTQAEGAKCLQVTAEHSAQILQAVIQPFNKTLEMMHAAYNHESTRADKASDAVVRMLNAREPSESTADTVVKLVGVVPAAVTAVKSINKALKED